jgi:hypothetical protein
VEFYTTGASMSRTGMIDSNKSRILSFSQLIEMETLYSASFPVAFIQNHPMDLSYR